MSGLERGHEVGERQRYCLGCMDLNMREARARDEAGAVKCGVSVAEYREARQRTIVRLFKAGVGRIELSERYGLSRTAVGRTIRQALGSRAKPSAGMDEGTESGAISSGVAVDGDELMAFLGESLRIEGIDRAPTEEEIGATEKFLRLEAVTVEDVCGLVTVYEPGAVLRTEVGQGVRVGRYVAPAGGMEIYYRLEHMLRGLQRASPVRWHRAYEKLHPFTDGNGRSGRALWAWQVLRRQRGVPLGFLRQWYYDTLA